MTARHARQAAAVQLMALTIAVATAQAPALAHSYGVTTVSATSAEPGDTILIGAVSVQQTNVAHRVRFSHSSVACEFTPVVVGGSVNSDASGNITPVARVIPTNSTSGIRWLCWMAVNGNSFPTTPKAITIL